jgi:site-specific recombinase XerD
LRSAVVFATELYPKKEFKLPEILSEEQVLHLLKSIINPKHKLIVGLFYGTGMRLNELCHLKMEQIDRKNMQIKILAGKGNKDRFTLLPKHLLPEMEAYYRAYLPKTYLFEGQKQGFPLNDRSVQQAVKSCMQLAGFEKFGFSSHTFRHSFATHLLDQGNDIHTIKELLGHSKIETTMIYLHLQKKKRAALCSPLDFLLNQND